MTSLVLNIVKSVACPVQAMRKRSLPMPHQVRTNVGAIDGIRFLIYMQTSTVKMAEPQSTIQQHKPRQSPTEIEVSSDQNLSARQLQIVSRSISLMVLLLGHHAHGQQGPLPKFDFQGIALHPKDLRYSPNEDLIHPTIVKTEGRIKDPLGKYYLYHAPHKHIATSMAYSDSLDGPWTEYNGNPVVEGPSAPEIRWIDEHSKFFLWGHRKNSQTELWTSEDGIHFKHDSVSIKAGNIGTRNASYNRVYKYPLERFGSKYIMLYSGFLEERGIRCIWLAYSKDAKNWTQIRTPLVEPIDGEMNDCYGPALLRWQGRNFITYQDHTSWRGGNLKSVEVDLELNPIGAGGERYLLVDPPSEPPLNNRLRGTEFYQAGETLYLYSSASRAPRLLVYATAKMTQRDAATTQSSITEPPSKQQLQSIEPDSHGTPTRPSVDAQPNLSKAQLKEAKRKAKQARKSKASDSSRPADASIRPRASVTATTSLDEILKKAELETVYETTFDKPLQVIREDELVVGKNYAREPAEDVDWVLEGPGDVTVKDGRMHFRNSPDGNAVIWNTREFPENFVAEWDFQHHRPQGTAIIFFAARGPQEGSIYAPGLPRRTGNFGNYTRGKIRTYHISYSATDEAGVPRGGTHLKKDILDDVLGAGGKLCTGPSHIDGATGKVHKLRLTKLRNRIVLDVNGDVCIDCTDDGKKGGPPLNSGRIGFRQMRHCIECSYGFLKVQRITRVPSR